MNPPSYIEISSANLVHNLDTFREMLQKQAIVVAVVKANAYGHGLAEVVKSLNGKVDYFQVDDLIELKELRRVTESPTLLLGYVPDSELDEVLSLGAELAVYDNRNLVALAKAAERLGKRAKVHLAIDAHLGREGILSDKLEEFLSELKRHPSIELSGTYGHFANIEDTSDFTHAKKQLEDYDAALGTLRQHGYGDIATHISATSGILIHELTSGHNSMVRLGIGLYGLWPSEDLKVRFEDQGIILKPVMRWISSIAQVKDLPKDYSVGYGLTYVTSRETTVALIPMGYSDGYDRGLSNLGEVIIGGKRCPVIGRVAMNMFVADVSQVAYVSAAQEVILLGTDNQGASMSAEEMAEKLATINYEVVARISASLPRLVI